MTTTFTVENDFILPGRNCGACGKRTCEDFSNAVKEGVSNIHDCPFYIPVSNKVKDSNVESAVYSGVDVVGQKYDFWLAPIPGEISARKIILPYRPDLVEKWDIQKGDIVTGRPSGAGCPVQHVIKVLDANPITGVIMGFVVGPSYARNHDVKDVMEYHMLGFEGRAMVLGDAPQFGKRYSFLPGFCMMGRAHTGLVNTIIGKPWGLQVRIEGIVIM